MTAFIAAYDTEKPHACLSPCRKIAAVHRKLEIPATFFVVGSLLESEAEEFAVYRSFIDKAIAEELEYVSLIWHPWSLDRFDPDMAMLKMLIAYSQSKCMPFLRYADV